MVQKTSADWEAEIRELKVHNWQLAREIAFLGEQMKDKDRQIEALRTLVYIDPLTGVGNRRFFEEEILKLKNTAETFCVAMIDLDLLKKVNGDYGHAMGDRVLKKLGAILSAEQRGEDSIARVGGDEFLVILRDCRYAGAEVYLNRLQDRIREDLMLQSPSGSLMRFTASLGCAERQLNEDEKSLMYRADIALRRAKDMGKDCLVLAR